VPRNARAASETGLECEHQNAAEAEAEGEGEGEFAELESETVRMFCVWGAQAMGSWMLCVARVQEEPVLPPSEFDALDTETLKRLLGELRGDTDRVARERAEAQVDRVRRCDWMRWPQP